MKGWAGGRHKFNYMYNHPSYLKQPQVQRTSDYRYGLLSAQKDVDVWLASVQGERSQSISVMSSQGSWHMTHLLSVVFKDSLVDIGSFQLEREREGGRGERERGGGGGGD